MQDAAQLRARAARCIEIARQLRDRNAGEQLCAEAMESFARALELETQSDPPVSESSAVAAVHERQWAGPCPSANGRAVANEESQVSQSDTWNKIFYCRMLQTTIGQELRARYGPLPKELPHQILALLMQLTEHGQTKPLPPPPRRPADESRRDFPKICRRV
jgi:hypothetical protein